jgi:hypothetical protein
MKAMILILVLLAPLARADLTRAEEADFQVMVDPSVYPVKAFEKEGVKASARPGHTKSGSIPDREQREAAFASVKNLDVSGLDELDRDRLYVLAKTRSFADLRKSFPKFPAQILKNLQRKLQR